MENIYILYTRDEFKYRTVVGIIPEKTFSRFFIRGNQPIIIKKYYNVKHLYYRIIRNTMTGDNRLGADRYTI